MSRRKKRSTKELIVKSNKISSIYVYDKTFELSRDKSKGRALLSFDITYPNSKRENMDYSLPVKSIWISSEDNTAIRAYLELRSGYRNNILISALNEFKYIRVSGSSKYISYRGGIIRYGEMGEAVPEISDSDYKTHFIYTNKTILLHNIIEIINQYRNVIGYKKCNLSLFPDKVLQVFGFSKIEDYFGRMDPMWVARPSLIIQPDSSVDKYGYRENRSNLRRRGEMFIKILESLVSGQDVTTAIKSFNVR
jgi:hypothetical protein